MSSRIGVYSGTFDPIHRGHIAFSQAAIRACGLDEVVLLPERRPRNKHNVTDILHRIALIERATEAITSLRVLDLPSEQFTVKDTLPELRSLLGNTPMVFLVGSDVVRTFAYRWEGLELLFNDVSFAISVRADDDADEIAAIMAQLEKEYRTLIRYTCIHTSDADLASSQLRDGSADMSRLPNPTMLDYIHKHGLYSQA